LGKETKETFDAQETKNMLNKLSKKMEEMKHNPKLNRAQIATYEKSIKQFNEAAKSLD
jgi:hypothetical protein